MYIFESIFPIVAISALAYFLARKCFLQEKEILGLEKITFNFLIPCMLFVGASTASLPESMDWGLLWGYYLPVLVMYLLGMLMAWLGFKMSQKTQAVVGMGCAYPNVTILGIPICLELLGEAAFVPIFIIVSIHNLLIFSFGIIVAEARDQENRALGEHLWHVLKQVLRNPISGSLLIGIIVNLASIPLYQPIFSALELLARGAVPAALLTLGAGLTRYKIRGDLGLAMWIVGLKLLVLPALVWCLTVFVFEMPYIWSQTAVLLSAMPVGISVYVFAIRYRCCENLAASTIVLSCVMSVFTVSFFAYILGI